MKKFFCCILCVLMLTVSLPLGVLAADPFSQWDLTGWTKGTDGGQSIIHGDPGAQMNLLWLKGTTTGNTLSFDVRIDSSTGTVDGSVGAAYKCPNGFQYFFEYNTVGHLVRIRRIGDDGSDNHISPGRSLSLDLNKWYHFDLTFDENRIVWQIDGETVGEASNTYGDTMKGGRVYIQGYYASPSLKNIVISDVKSEDTPVTKKDIDFEFGSSASVDGFTAEKGTVGWSDGRLTFTLGGADASLTSPVFAPETGTAYSAKLSVRNTLLVRMSNRTAASRMKVYFITDADMTWNEAKSAVFDVAPQSGDTTYYFNFSGIKGWAGYLRGLRFCPLGASSGTITIDAVSFEREADTSRKTAGQVISCTTDGNNVTIRGTLGTEFAGKTVDLYETTIDNFSESLKAGEIIASVQASGTDFTITVPFKEGKTSRLSSQFLCGVGGVPLGGRFTVENYKDFTDNPYAFTLPDYTVSVLDTGAKGDGFTNDTAAIQSALDKVSAHGGGTVVIPGDDSLYGRRYVVTHLLLRDNTELRIETGAVLWQSPRVSDYDYDVVYGHDYPIAGVNWTHACSCHNLPLLHGDRVKNVKVTGGGTIRMQDTGGECLDSVSGSIWTGCEHRIHLIPLGFWKCENIEVRGISIKRNNNYHINFRTCERIYVADVTMNEVTCASGDGISATVGTKHITIDRCFFYSNDDAVTICSTYDDPRGIAWWHAQPGEDNCIDDLCVRHSNLSGGHGVTFITWGTDAPDQSLQEIKNVTVYDCVLAGGSAAVGAWPDNPYYGRQPYDNTETNDYSPVKNVRLYDNTYRSATTLECIQATSVFSDCTIRSAADFVNGTFERKGGKSGWVMGLANWDTDLLSDNAAVTVEGKDKAHYAVLTGDARLYEGLWMSKGAHTVTADITPSGVETVLYAADPDTGKILYSAAVSEAGKASLTFTQAKAGVLYLGVSHTGAGSAQADNFTVTSEVIKPETYFSESFDDGECINMTNKGFEAVMENGNGYLATPKAQSGVMTLLCDHTYKGVDLCFRVRFDAVNSDVDANLGVSLMRQDGNNQYDLHYDPLRHCLNVRKFQNGQETLLTRVTDYDMTPGEWVDMAFRVRDGKILWYVNGQPAAVVEDSTFASGMVMLCGYNVSMALDDVRVGRPGSLVITGDEDPAELATDPPETEPETAPETQPDEETDSKDTSGNTEPVSDAPATADVPAASDTEPGIAPARGCSSHLSTIAGLCVLLAMTAAALWIAAGRKGKRA
ncbi:MAG: glycosyl hydrolase family 28 protein [Clostridia bacterium]|nr:glycosyl hydrolase family 28 protein [Clostridia bacterium]